MFRQRLLPFLFTIILLLVNFSTASPTAQAAPNAAIAVDTLDDEFNDDGDCSLREAMYAANFNTTKDTCPGGDSSTDTITFSVNGTILLGFYLPPVKNSGPLVIDGGNQITISGNNTWRVFSVESGANLTLKNLTVSWGKVTDAIGAGLYNDNGFVSIQNCTFEYNKALGNAYPGGGAIYSDNGTGGNLTISNSTFNNNQSSEYGGAISYSGGNSATIENSTFIANTALNGGAIYANFVNLDIDNTTFQNNYAIGPTNDSERGGAMYVYEADVLIQDSTIKANGADSGGGITAIYFSEIKIENTLISQNQAQVGGGAISTGALTDLIISHTTFDNNQGGTRGGAISVTQSESEDSSITDCTFTVNSADKGGAIYGNLLDGVIARNTFYNNTAYQEGGALYSTSSVGPDYSDLQLVNNTISGNNAGWGGAVYNSDSKVTLTNNTLQDNNALYTGNNLYNDYLAFGVLTVTNTIVADDNTGSNCIGMITDGGHNIDRGTTCGFDPANGSLNNTDALLGALEDNGGPNPTHALLTGSPAINAADPALCPAVDQRSFSRRSGYCDIGAFEAQPAALTALSGFGQRVKISSVFPNPLVAEAVDAVGNTLGGVIITFTGPASGAGISNSGGPLTTGANGRVSFTATANGVPGTYLVTAAADSLSASDSLSNLGFIFLPLIVR
jgi:CSLREA domain-containing protein